MNFRGCFIGLDRYASDQITQLSSAVRDAEALHALFSDNVGPSAELLRDSEATADNVRKALQRLGASTEDDIAVVAFSGHGSSTHQLVTYDADIHDLARSCLSLDELTEALGAIPARQLICIPTAVSPAALAPRFSSRRACHEPSMPRPRPPPSSKPWPAPVVSS